MSELSELVYSPLLEEEETLIGWSKSTVEYCTKNPKVVYNSIRGIAKSRAGRLLSQNDTDDIYSELLQYLYQCDDWNISKAYERSSSNSIVSLSAYVHVCTKYVTIRYITKMYEYESNTVHDTVKETDGKELSLFDTIPDVHAGEMMDNITYNLDKICESYEYMRYHLGPDIFQMWFVRLKTMQLEKTEKYNDILAVLGISKKDISRVQLDRSNDSVMLNIAKAVTLIGVDQAVDIIRKYVYCADKLEKVVELA